MQIEFVPYPPASFPYRDLLVLEQLSVYPSHRVCEIGVGSGQTAVRLARLCAEVTGVEISAPTVQALRYLERHHKNLRFIGADVTDHDALSARSGRFDRVLSCDTLAHVANPTGFFRGVAALLAPGGEFAITFPNEPREAMHGITRFDSPAQLIELVAAAGLTDLRLGAARLTPHAGRVAQALGWTPLSMARELIAAGGALSARIRPKAAPAAPATRQPPQTFEETRFFRTMRLWQLLSPTVNLYWYAVLHLMSARGPAFDIDWDFPHAIR